MNDIDLTLRSHTNLSMFEAIWECHDKTNTNNWVIDFGRAIEAKVRGQ